MTNRNEVTKEDDKNEKKKRLVALRRKSNSERESLSFSDVWRLVKKVV